MKPSAKCGEVCIHPLAIEFSVISDSSPILYDDVRNGMKLLLSSCCYGSDDLCILFYFQNDSFSDHDMNRIGEVARQSQQELKRLSQEMKLEKIEHLHFHKPPPTHTHTHTLVYEFRSSLSYLPACMIQI